jgi:lipopolysaccharide export LptBFGC system permease protein LptF
MFDTMTRTIMSLPELVDELLIIAAVVACSVGLHAFLQRRFRTEILRRHNDVAGYLFSAVGVLYAVVLGFVVVVVWQKYDSTVTNVIAEVDGGADLYHVMDGFTPATRDAVRSDLRGYAHALITQEWPAMDRNEDVPEYAAPMIEDMSYRINTFEPGTLRQSNAQQAAIADVQRLFDARRERLIRSAPAVPFVLWFALVAGALSMLAFCVIFGVENRPAQLTMTAILMGLIGILFVVIYEFATPFSGSVKISSDGWAFLQERISHIR